MTYILPAEWLGNAEIVDGYVDVGGVKVHAPWSMASVYVRRSSSDLSILEIHLARHDGLAQEEFDEQIRQADEYPLGPKEYWRSEMVGKYMIGTDQHLMTDQEFEEDWSEDDECCDECHEDPDMLAFDCIDCTVNTFENDEYYMVQFELWETYGVEEGMLCIGCLEDRMGRQLTSEDFIEAPINHEEVFSKSNRFLDRWGSGPKALDK